MNRDGFVFYRSWAQALDSLPADAYKACMQALIGYALDGVADPACPEAQMFLTMAKPYIDINNRRRANGQKGGRPKTDDKPSDNQTETKQKPSSNQTETKREPYTVTETETETETVNNKSKRRFVKPTVDEIRAYCAERGNSIDAQHFYDYYESNGWLIGGKSHVRDWRACVRTWEQRDKAKPRPAGKFNNFESRSYDYDSLEAQLLRAQGG